MLSYVTVLDSEQQGNDKRREQIRVLAVPSSSLQNTHTHLTDTVQGQYLLLRSFRLAMENQNAMHTHFANNSLVCTFGLAASGRHIHHVHKSNYEGNCLQGTLLVPYNKSIVCRCRGSQSSLLISHEYRYSSCDH